MARQWNRGHGWPWTESISDEEMEEADLFWEELVGETRNRRTRRGGALTTSTTPTSTCLSPTRNADFANNLAPTTTMPRPEICKLIVTQRAGAIPGAPVSGAGTGGGGGTGGQTGQDPNNGGGAGAGGLQPGQARPGTAELIHAVGTGFFIAHNRIVTCAHVVLDAVSVTVVPGKMGASASSTAEPFGRFAVNAGHIAIAPGAITAITTPGPSHQFFSHDLAVIRNFSFAPLPTHPWGPGSVYKLAGPPSPNTCVGTAGYSAVTVNGNFQHIDRGFSQAGGPLVNFNLKTEKGASGSPIWSVPPLPGTASGAMPRQVVGIVAMGNATLHTGSPALTASHINFLKLA